MHMLKLPPLNPLRVFEVVARTQNLTLAAVELRVSQSAVSRQIGVLETYLGIQLFRRERLGVALTVAGIEYAKKIAPAFQVISSATMDLTGHRDDDTLRIRTYTTFAARWLIPHLGDLKNNHAELKVVISNAVQNVEFSRDQVDLAIQYGDGGWDNVDVDLLFEDEIEPVCTPGYLAFHQEKGGAPESMLKERLLISRYRRADWEDWLEATGYQAQAASTELMTFSSSILTWQAALDSLGMAIGQTHLLKSELDAGRLVRPFSRPVRRKGHGYYLVRSPLHRYSHKVELFRNWILDVIRREHATTPPV